MSWRHAWGRGSAALLAGLLPCPLSLGWVKGLDVELSRENGGYSAIAFESQRHQLVLLSDLPSAELSTWSLPSRGLQPRRLSSVRLQAGLWQQQPQILDSEGLVMSGDQVWVASEGRRRDDRPALLLRFSRRDGTLLQRVPLPETWQAGERQGLQTNAGPESLARLSAPGARLELLTAAERPLLQDTSDRIRLLRWWWPPGNDPNVDPPMAMEQGTLLIPEQPGWGLTDLVVLQEAAPGERAPLLLTLWRRFREPLHWENQLRLYPLPRNGATVQALVSWDLQAIGLTPENWEGISLGPLMSAGQPSIVLVSDDNLSSLQSSRLALLVARRSPSCDQP